MLFPFKGIYNFLTKGIFPIYFISWHFRHSVSYSDMLDVKVFERGLADFNVKQKDSKKK